MSANDPVVQYSVRHVTRFAYSAPISESIMEVRMQPRTDSGQHCLRFDLSTVPRVRPFMYRDFVGNIVHHFDVPGRHGRLTIVAEALVAMSERDELPERLPDDAWTQLDAPATRDVHADALAPSRFARETPLLHAFAREIGLDRGVRSPCSNAGRVRRLAHSRATRVDRRSTTLQSSRGCQTLRTHDDASVCWAFRAFA